MSSASPHTGNAASAISPSKLSISVSAGSLPHPTSTSPSVSPTGSVSSVTFQLSTGNGSTPAIRMTRGQRLRDQAAQARSTASATPEPTLPPQPDGNMKKRINQRNKTSATLGTELKSKSTTPVNPLPLHNISGNSSSSSSSTVSPAPTASVASARVNRRSRLVVKNGNNANTTTGTRTPIPRGTVTGNGTGNTSAGPSTSRPNTGKHPRLSISDRAILQDICIIQDWLTTVKQNGNLSKFSHIIDKLKTCIFMPTQVKRQRIKQRSAAGQPRMLHRINSMGTSRPTTAPQQPPLSSEGEDSGREYVVAGQGRDEDDSSDDFILNDDDELDAKMTQYINRTEQDDDNLLMRRTVKSPTGVVFENGRWVAASPATTGPTAVHRHVGTGTITSLTSLSSLLIKGSSGTSTPFNEMNDDIVSSLSSNAENDADGDGEGEVEEEETEARPEFPDNLDDIADFDDDPSSGNVSSTNNQATMSDAVLSPSSTSSTCQSGLSSPASSLTRHSSQSSLQGVMELPAPAITAPTARLQHFREASSDFDVGTDVLTEIQRRKVPSVHVMAKPTLTPPTHMMDIGDDMEALESIPDFDNTSPSHTTNDETMSISNSAPSSVMSSPTAATAAAAAQQLQQQQRSSSLPRDTISPPNSSLSIHVSTISPAMLTITTMRTSNITTPTTGTGSGSNSTTQSPAMSTASLTGTPSKSTNSSFQPALSPIFSETSMTSTPSVTSTSHLSVPALDIDDMSDGDDVSSRSRAPSHTSHITDDERTVDETEDPEFESMVEAIATKPTTTTTTPTLVTTTIVNHEPATNQRTNSIEFPDDLDGLEDFPDDDIPQDDMSSSSPTITTISPSKTKPTSIRRTSSASNSGDDVTSANKGMSGPSSRILNEFFVADITTSFQTSAELHNKTYSCLTPYLSKPSALTTKDPFQSQFVVNWVLELGRHFATATDLDKTPNTPHHSHSS